MNSAFFEAASGEGKTLTPAMFLIVLVLIGILTRIITATFATLVVVILSVSMTAGFAGLTGIKLTPLSSQFSIIILTLAVADSIHILMTIINKMKGGFDKKSAIAESLKLNFTPVAITSITTLNGFLSLNAGDVPPFWDLGNITAVGMLGAFIFSLTTLPTGDDNKSLVSFSSPRDVKLLIFFLSPPIRLRIQFYKHILLYKKLIYIVLQSIFHKKSLIFIR